MTSQVKLTRMSIRTGNRAIVPVPNFSLQQAHVLRPTCSHLIHALFQVRQTGRRPASEAVRSASPRHPCGCRAQ
jgi:hypothetical protein